MTGKKQRLTLVLSCAMKFQTYPHDTQNCTMKIESRKFEENGNQRWGGEFRFSILSATNQWKFFIANVVSFPFSLSFLLSQIAILVSYTTNDLIFDWELFDPLVVEDHIELPQHDLINKAIDDCTTDYSSGS